MTKKEYLTTSFVFILFILIGCYKLTNSSLWYDETIEYWYSKIMIGTLPNNIYKGELSNMYQRIVTTYQPPLYNFLMYFWLKLGDGEWWFRFSGVILGLICLIGIYKSVYLVSLESKKFYQKNNSSIWIYGIFKLSHLRKIQTPRKELFHV